MLLGTLGASLLGNLLTGKGINKAGKGKEINRAVKTKWINRAGEGIPRAGLVIILLKWIFNSIPSFN